MNTYLTQRMALLLMMLLAMPLLLCAQRPKSVTKTTSATAVNVETIFMMLPDDVLPESLTESQRKKLLAKQSTNTHSTLNVSDKRNGYLSLFFGQFEWAMCYWNLKDGRKLVAVNNRSESGDELTFFYYDKGRLLREPNYRVGDIDKLRLRDWVNDSNEWFQSLNKIYSSDYVRYELPRQGKSIKAWVDIEQLWMDSGHEGECPDIEWKTIIYRWVNERWQR